VHDFPSWKRLTAAVLAVAAIIPAAANAEPKRTATTTKYTRATFLQHALGLQTDNPVIESVTYDRFQHLLQQPGPFALLIGDPATDATFAARAQDVQAAAAAAGAKRVYWFNPNLSGNAKVGETTMPNLDIRNPGGITALSANSRTIYGRAWLNLVGQYLGNGVTAVQNNAGTQSATVTATVGTDTVNDAGGKEVGNPGSGALYDYTSGTAPADVQHSYFVVYSRADAAAKVRAWVDLTDAESSAATQADVTTALGTVGAAAIERLDQFEWWKSEANSRQNKQSPSTAQNGDVPVVTDAAKADGWRINQISYPELVDLLEHATDANAVILFGGTWCPNTRAVLPFVNKYAQENDVTVFNFDTVLDGGIVGGGTTSATNPLQSRNNAASGGAQNANPSFLYGGVVREYLNNLVTQYNPASNGVSFWPGGDTSGTLTTINRLQVPYLIGYQRKASGGVARQWIHKKADGTYTEYMSQWWYTNPQPDRLGLGTLPSGAPIWAKINAQLAQFTWRSDPTTLYPNTAIDTDAAEYLVPEDTATVTFTPPDNLSVTSGGANPIPIGPAQLAAALQALGASAPANYAAARAALIAAESGGTPNEHLRTVVGAWGVSQQRKTRVLSTWGDAGTPGSVAGGVAAVRALELFFGGLPGGVVSRRAVTVTPGTAPRITLRIENDFGRVPASKVALTVRRGGATVASQSAAVVNGTATFTLTGLAPGSYSFTLSYPGDDQLLAFTETGTVTVTAAPPAPTPTPTPPPVLAAPTPAPTATPSATTTKVKASKLAGRVTAKATRKKAGRYRITVTTPKGLAKATGKVTIRLKKGKTTRTVRAKLKAGTVTVRLPKLSRGTWKVRISWEGDANYLAGSATGASVKVAR